MPVLYIYPSDITLAIIIKFARKKILTSALSPK